LCVLVSFPSNAKDELYLPENVIALSDRAHSALIDRTHSALIDRTHSALIDRIHSALIDRTRTHIAHRIYPASKRRWSIHTERATYWMYEQYGLHHLIDDGLLCRGIGSIYHREAINPHNSCSRRITTPRSSLMLLASFVAVVVVVVVVGTPSAVPSASSTSTRSTSTTAAMSDHR